MSQFFNLKTTLIIILLALLASGIFYFQSRQSSIVSYDAVRDKEFIQQMFADEWYWFIPDNQKFSLDELFSPDEFTIRQQQTIKIAINEQGKPVGFIVYFMPKFYQGQIRFLGVNKNFRGQGYSKLLLTHAIQDLFKRGAKKITLMTRLINEPARSLYEKMGFRETKRHDLYIDYQITPATLKQ